MSQESKTPRTDAEAAEAANYASIAKGWYVHADFARQLETELAAMTEERDAFMASSRIKEENASVSLNSGKLLAEKDLAALVKLSPPMLQKMRREGKGPAYVRIGSSIRYPEADVFAWINSLRAATELGQ
jgi:predicted DNA-binding transcriptional regulator AlpA